MGRILTVACEIPGGFGHYVNIDSKTSLLDADFVLFRPTLGISSWEYEQHYMGKPSLSDSSSFRVQEAINYWRTEIADCVKSGKTVFLIMGPLEEVYVNTGEQRYSGTGRNRLTTDIVQLVSNYDVLPVLKEMYESEGKQMVLHSCGHILKEYWLQFGNESKYHVYMEQSTQFRPLVLTRHGDRIVGAIVRSKSGGALVALPWVEFYRKEFVSEQLKDKKDVGRKQTWTVKARSWGTEVFSGA